VALSSEFAGAVFTGGRGLRSVARRRADSLAGFARPDGGARRRFFCWETFTGRRF